MAGLTPISVFRSASRSSVCLSICFLSVCLSDAPICLPAHLPSPALSASQAPFFSPRPPPRAFPPQGLMQAAIQASAPPLAAALRQVSPRFSANPTPSHTCVPVLPHFKSNTLILSIKHTQHIYLGPKQSPFIRLLQTRAFPTAAPPFHPLPPAPFHPPLFIPGRQRCSTGCTRRSEWPASTPSSTASTARCSSARLTPTMPRSGPDQDLDPLRSTWI